MQKISKAVWLFEKDGTQFDNHPCNWSYLLKLRTHENWISGGQIEREDVGGRYNPALTYLIAQHPRGRYAIHFGSSAAGITIFSGLRVWDEFFFEVEADAIEFRLRFG